MKQVSHRGYLLVEEIMKLRYIVEGKFAATFTASEKVKSQDDANRMVFSLKLLNQKEGYMKYSGFILYDNDNKIIHRY